MDTVNPGASSFFIYGSAFLGDAAFAIAGIVKLGAIAAVVNTKQRGKLLQHSLQISNAKLHVVGEELWDGFAEVRRGTADFGGTPLTSRRPETADGIGLGPQGDDLFVAKYSGSDGSHVWSKGFGSGGDEWGNGVSVDGSGDVVITGSFGDSVPGAFPRLDFGGGPLTSAGAHDIFVAKLAAVVNRHKQVVLVPGKALSHRIVLSAWTVLDRMDEFCSLIGREITSADGKTTGVVSEVRIKSDGLIAVLEGGKEVAIGDGIVVRDSIKSISDLRGRTVVPGLADDHFHSAGGGPGVDLSRVRSLDELLKAIADRIKQSRPGELIITNSDWHEAQLQEQPFSPQYITICFGWYA